MSSARPFSRATVGGNPVGRPRTTPEEPNARTRALIAARNWQAKRGAAANSDAPTARSAGTGASIAAARGEQRRGTRFDGEERLGRAERLPRPNSDA